MFFAHAHQFRHRQEHRDVAQPAPVVSGGMAIRPSVKGTVTGVNKTTIDDGHDMIGADAGLTLQVLDSDLTKSVAAFSATRETKTARQYMATSNGDITQYISERL